MQAVEMRAAGQPFRLAVAEREVPKPGRGEVLVRVKAASLNYRDLMQAQGLFPSGEGRIPLCDGAGEVAALGTGVTRFRPGDRVMSLFFPRWRSGPPTEQAIEVVTGHAIDGFAAEYACVSASYLTAMPRDWSFAEAATLPCAGLTAWRALVVEGRLRAGATVVVQGSGGVSVFAAQLAKAYGATVIATSSSPAKIERFRALGVDHVINYREIPEWGDEAMRLTGGRGADIVLDVGGPGTMDQSVAALRVGGTMVLVGTLGGWSGNFFSAKAISRNLTLKAITVGSRAMQEGMVRALEDLPIRPVIDRTFPLGQIGEAFLRMEQQSHFGKICLEMPG